MAEETWAAMVAGRYVARSPRSRARTDSSCTARPAHHRRNRRQPDSSVRSWGWQARTALVASVLVRRGHGQLARGRVAHFCCKSCSGGMQH